jgi:hypothetical protein
MSRNAAKSIPIFFEGVPPDRTVQEYCRRLVIVFADGYLTGDEIADAVDPSVSDEQANAAIVAAMHKLHTKQ